MATKWGIVGNGNICGDFTLCLRNLPRPEHQIVAVGAPTLEEAQKFATTHLIPKAYGSPEALSEDTEVEIVYIGYLNPLHYKLSKMMLEAGKHVLCEKPMCMNLEQTEKLIALAKEKKRFLMEGIWSRCFPVYEQTRKDMASGMIGKPTLVQASAGFNNRHLDRVRKRSLGGGAVADLGIYALHLATMVFGGERPEEIMASGYVNDDGIDECESITLRYSKERMASFLFATRNALCNEAVISGADGFLRMNGPFWCPTTLENPNKTHRFHLPDILEPVHYTNSQGLTYEAMEVRRCLLEGLISSPLVPLEDTRTVAYIMAEIRRQLGVDMSFVKDE